MTRTLINYSDNIKNNNFEWLEYKKFIELEKDLINKNGITESNIVKNLIDGSLGLEEKDSDTNNLSDIESNTNMIIDIESSGEKDIPFTSNDKNLDKKSSQSEDDDYNGIPLYDRLLKDKRCENYKDIISDLKINTGKRLSNDDEDIIIEPPLTKKIKVIYPKNK